MSRMESCRFPTVGQARCVSFNENLQFKTFGFGIYFPRPPPHCTRTLTQRSHNGKKATVTVTGEILPRTASGITNSGGAHRTNRNDRNVPCPLGEPVDSGPCSSRDCHWDWWPWPRRLVRPLHILSGPISTTLNRQDVPKANVVARARCYPICDRLSNEQMFALLLVILTGGSLRAATPVVGERTSIHRSEAVLTACR